MSHYLLHKTKTFEEFDITKYEEQMPDSHMIAQKYGSKLRSQFSYINSDVFEGSDEERHRRSTNGPENITSNQELPDLEGEDSQKPAIQKAVQIKGAEKETQKTKLGSSSNTYQP